MKISTPFSALLLCCLASFTYAQNASGDASSADANQAELQRRQAIAQIVNEDQPMVFESPTGFFSMPVPVRSGLGGQVDVRGATVIFQDQFTTSIFVTAIEMDATQRWQLNTKGRKDYLTEFLANSLLLSLREGDPRSGIEVAKYLPSTNEGSVFAIALLPGGGNFLFRCSMTEGNIPVAKRGLLLFVHNEVLYVLSTELGERTTEGSLYKASKDEEEKVLRERLLSLAASIQFTPPPPSTTPVAAPTAK